MMTLTNWKIENGELIGCVSGSKQYKNGTYVHTSPVITTVYDDGLFLFRTEHSVYECMATEFIGTEVQLNQLIANAESNDPQTTEQINLEDYKK
ncbi:MAG: hypothetical protein ACOYBK_04920 [Bilifractor sp.]|jgi:hypothetical protein|nr:hypothetical protein [Lachnospiraceae bacterium]